MSENRSIVQSTAVLLTLAVLSPAAGMALQMVLAYIYGSGPLVDGFRVGVLLVQFGRQFFLGQILVAIIVPMLTEHRAQGELLTGLRLAFTAGLFLLVFLTPAMLVALFRPSWLQSLLAPGLNGGGGRSARFFIRVFALTLVALCFTGIANAILHGYRVFWLKRTRQLLRNFIVIVCILIAGAYAEYWSLAAGVLLGTIAGVGIGAYWLLKALGDSNIGPCDIMVPHFSRELFRMGKMALPLMGALISVQWIMVVLYRCMSAFPAGTLANFGYSWKLRQGGVLIPICLSTVLFPSFSRCAAEDDISELRRLCGRYTKLILFISVPTAIIVYVCALPITEVVFLRGEMNVASVQQIAFYLSIFAFVMPAQAIMRLATKVSFAMKDSLGPFFRQLIIAAGITAFAVMATELENSSTVLVTHTGLFWGSTLFLLTYLQIRYGLWTSQRMQGFLFRMGLLGAVFAAATVAGLHAAQSAITPNSIWGRVGVLAFVGLLGAGVLMSVGLLLNFSCARDIWDYGREQLERAVEACSKVAGLRQEIK